MRIRRYGKKCIENKAEDLRVSIDERLLEVETQEAFGHFEIDTIVGKGRKSGVLTVVERQKRITFATIIPDFNPKPINEALYELMNPHAWMIKSITADNGFEFNDWESIKTVFSCDFNFSHAYSSWERGTVENTNGLFPRMYPKRTDLNLVDKA